MSQFERLSRVGSLKAGKQEFRTRSHESGAMSYYPSDFWLPTAPEFLSLNDMSLQVTVLTASEKVGWLLNQLWFPVSNRYRYENVCSGLLGR